MPDVRLFLAQPRTNNKPIHNELTFSPAFCDFYLTLNAKPWEVIFEQKFDYDVLESGLRGGAWRKFAIHLPEGAV